MFVKNDSVDWNADSLASCRKSNDDQQWLPGCWECEKLERVKVKSFRQAMIDKFGIKHGLSGPQRIDLLFDRSCNLACRTCGPMSSTFWYKHLKDNNLPSAEYEQTNNLSKIQAILEKLDLSNVEMIQFCGGETLLGSTYWQTAELLAKLIPDAKHKVELGFQTNCTQSIDPRWFDVISKFKLVKLILSIDGIGDRFDYLRWPANWNQVQQNIFELRQNLPSNVMFFVQETTSCLNLLYFGQVGDWVKQNFATNREGDPVEHSTQLAIHGYLDVKNITQEYRDAIAHKPMVHAIGRSWQEEPTRIKNFIAETEKFDRLRNQDWKKTFPELVDFYRRYI